MSFELRLLLSDLHQPAYFLQGQSKAELIEERKANLPLPEEPLTASDWNSADERTVKVGFGGGVQSDFSYGGGSSSLRGPSTTNDTEKVGREAKDNLEGPPKDAAKK